MSQAELPEHSCVFIRLPGRTEFLAVERALVQTVCQLCGFGEQEIHRIVLAVDEACTNVIRHGYGGPSDEIIEISAMQVGGDFGGVMIKIRDYGKQVDPEELIPRKRDEMHAGGQGVNIIYNVMDEVAYSRADGGGMQLLLTKRLAVDGERDETDASPSKSE